MGQNLCARTEAERIAAHHPGAVAWDVAPLDSGKAETDEQNHRRTYQESNGVKDSSVILDVQIKLGHPQACERGNQPTRDHNPSGSAVLVGFAAAETGEELEGAE